MDENLIKFIEKNNLKNFKQIEIYESLTNKSTKKIKVSKLYGNNGEIINKELENMRANLCEFNIKN